MLHQNVETKFQRDATSNDVDSDIASEDEESIRKFCAGTSWDDFLLALYDVRIAAPIVAIIAMFLAYHITIAPYRVHVEHGEFVSPLDLDLNLVRPVIAEGKMTQMRNLLLNAETSIELPTLEMVRFKFHAATNEFGAFRLPHMFYTGVTFGLTSQNSHNIQHTSYNTLGLEDLNVDLHALSGVYKPTFIMKRSAVSVNDTMWEEEGFAVYYSYADLEARGKLSSDKERPWKRIADGILQLARRHKQSYITVWYSRDFGPDPKETSSAAVTSNSGGVKPQKMPFAAATTSALSTQPLTPLSAARRRLHSLTDPHLHRVLLQEILPTRTGLDALKSSVTVWLTSVDDIPPHLIDFVSSEDW